jgi:protein-disulfide isomerase
MGRAATVCLFLSAVLSASVALAQSVGSAEALDSAQQSKLILEELRAIHKLLEKVLAQPSAARPATAAAAAPDTRIKVAVLPGDRFLGKADAPLTMVEFTDLQCPFCRQFHTTAFEQIKREYIDIGKLRFISRDMPLPQIHPVAEAAAKASLCAGEQGADKFWEMRHAVLLNNRALKPEMLATFAQDLKLNMDKYSACAADANRFVPALEADQKMASEAGIKGTPTFVVGRSSAGGVEGVRLVGALPFADFDARLKQALAEK